jgi:ribosome recycling factor
MPADEILMECEEHMIKAMEHLKHELRGLRTGRASPALLEYLKVEYYGTLTDLKSIAMISVPEATQLLVKPFTPQDCKAIEKAIGDANMGLTPHSDGKQIRIQLPAMSQDRRIKLAGQAKEHGETAKIAIRGARRDANKAVEGDDTLTEDEQKKTKEDIQELLKKYEGDIETTVESKKKDIMEL